MPKVSIIIPAYNQDKYLEETLLSVLSQSYSDYECIIVDDGSTDETRNVANKYIDGSKVKYIYQENKGLAGARNTGIGKAKGKYLHFLDSDDLMYEDFLSSMTDKLDDDAGINILSCAWDFIDEKSKTISSKIGPAMSNDYTKDLILQNLFPVHSAIIRKKVLDHIGLFNERLSAMEDWDLWLRAAINNFRFDTMDILGVGYRRHKEAMTLDIKRMKGNLDLFLDNFFGANPGYLQYRPYTHLLQLLNIYLYAEEAGDPVVQREILEEVQEHLGYTSYIHYYMEKVYETIRQIKDKRIKQRLVKNIYDIAPPENKRFWKEKSLKLRLKGIIDLVIP